MLIKLWLAGIPIVFSLIILYYAFKAKNGENVLALFIAGLDKNGPAFGIMVLWPIVLACVIIFTCFVVSAGILLSPALVYLFLFKRQSFYKTIRIKP